MGPDKKLKYGKLLKYFPASKRGYAILNSEKTPEKDKVYQRLCSQ
jgi:hypothetical protein